MDDTVIVARQGGYVYDDLIGYCKQCTGRAKETGLMAVGTIGVSIIICCAIVYRFHRAVGHFLFRHFALLQYIRKNFVRLRVKGKIVVSRYARVTMRQRTAPCVIALGAPLVVLGDVLSDHFAILRRSDESPVAKSVCKNRPQV